MTPNAASCTSQNGKAKSEIVPQIVRIVRKEGLDYEAWRYVAKQVRKQCDLQPAKKGRKLPRILTADEFRRFYQVVDQADDVQHALMLRLLFYTAVRVSELCSIEVADVDLENCKIMVEPGQGQQGPLRPVWQVLRHRLADPHRRPPAATAGCSRPGGTRSTPPGGCSRSSSSTPRKLASKPRRTPSGIRRSPGSPGTPAWQTLNCNSSRGTPEGRRWPLPARRPGRRPGAEVPGHDEGGGTVAHNRTTTTTGAGGRPGRTPQPAIRSPLLPRFSPADRTPQSVLAQDQRSVCGLRSAEHCPRLPDRSQRSAVCGLRCVRLRLPTCCDQPSAVCGKRSAECGSPPPTSVVKVVVWRFL